MKASERLRELEAAARPDIDAVVVEQEARLTRYVREATGNDSLTVEAGSPMLTVARALPLIADVVEAAEKFTAAVDLSLSHGLQPALSFATAERVTLDEKLRPALTALNNALEEDVQWPDGDEVGHPTC